MKKTMIAKTLAVGGLIALGSGVAYAGPIWASYDTTVGKFNGSGYTSYQTKTYDSAAGGVSSRTAGGSYTVDVRMNSADGNGSWARALNDNDSRNLSNSIHKGNSTRLQFSNNLNTPVNVQVTGSWRSN